MPITANSLGLILRQEVAVGKTFSGVRTAHVNGVEEPAIYNSRSHLFAYNLLLGATPANGAVGFDFVDGGAGNDSIVRNDGGSWIEEGYRVGEDVTVANANTVGNDGPHTILAISASTIEVATASFTADAADTTADFAHEGGEGLFEFDPFVTSPLASRPLVFVSWVKIKIGSGAAWSIRITDGDEGDTPYNIDDPSLDVELDSGTGDASVRVMRDFPPKSKLRVITDAAVGAKGIVEVEFHPAVDSFSRPFN